MVADPDLYGWFRHRQPDAQPGYGLLVYEVQPDDTAPQWVAQCSQPAVPLTHEAIVAGFGRSDLREIIFDCTQSWIYPTGGAVPGWYALHGNGNPDAFTTSRLAKGGAVESYRQNRPGLLPPFNLYVQEDGPVAPNSPYTNPIRFGPPADRIHARQADRRRRRVRRDRNLVGRCQRPRAPSSLMLHLGKLRGRAHRGGDGLGVPACLAGRRRDRTAACALR